MNLTAIVLLGAYGLLLAAAAVQDMRMLRISNMLAVATLGVAIALLLFVRQPDAWWGHLISFAIMLGVGIMLFSAGWMGGGDAKLAAGAAALFSPIELVWFVSATAIAGGILTMVLMILRNVKGATTQGRWLGLQKGQSIPYGVAIAIGAAWVAWMVVPPKPEDGLSRLRRIDLAAADQRESDPSNTSSETASL